MEVPRPVRVKHYYSIRGAAKALELGLPVRYYCGQSSESAPSSSSRVELVAEVMVATKDEDCPGCVRAYERYLADREAWLAANA